MKDRKRMEGRRKAALTAAGILVTCVFPVSFVLDGGHIAQTAGGNPFPTRPFFPAGLCLIHIS